MIINYYKDYKILDENIDIALEHLNFCKQELNNEERILIEKNPLLLLAFLLNEQPSRSKKISQLFQDIFQIFLKNKN